MGDTDAYLGSLNSLAFASEAAYGLDGEGRRHDGQCRVQLGHKTEDARVTWQYNLSLSR
jgi:hypothetical protein